MKENHRPAQSGIFPFRAGFRVKCEWEMSQKIGTRQSELLHFAPDRGIASSSDDSGTA